MSKGSSENKKTKIPLKWRLNAWWNGYDLDDLKAKLSKPMSNPERSNESLKNPATPDFHNQNSPDVHNKNSIEKHSPETPPPEIYNSYDRNGPASIDDDIEFSEDDHVVVKAVWDNNRAHVAQVFWGDGFCGPGGPENIINITESLKINSKRSIMVVGAGLGGPVRTMQKEYNTPVDGYESSTRLATDGMIMSVEAGVAQDAPIMHLDFENMTKFARRYDRAYAKESLFTIGNKLSLIQTIFDHLKDDGLFLLTDYVLSESADQSNALFNKWRLLEPDEPKPVTAGDMRSYLTNAGFTLRVNENITDLYLDLIGQARAHAKNVINTMEADGVQNLSILKYMHNEAAFWDTRAKLLRDGDLRVMKYLCYKSV